MFWEVIWTLSSQENGHHLEEPPQKSQMKWQPLKMNYAESLRMHHFLDGPLLG